MPENTLNREKRIYWMDNLWTFLIFLVVVIHVSVVYERYTMGLSAMPMVNA
jgi:surface polysaccharide O-acyltransferase-like enzyme